MASRHVSQAATTVASSTSASHRAGAGATAKVSYPPRAGPDQNRSRLASGAVSGDAGSKTGSPTMARRPVSGSMRTSAKALLHRHMLDPGLPEHAAVRPVARVLVQLAGVGLGMQDDAPRAGVQALAVGGLQQSGGDVATASGSAHGQAAELRRRADQDDPARGEDLALLDGDEMKALVIAAVELLTLGNALLDDEHVMAQGDRRLELLLAADPADLDRAERVVDAGAAADPRHDTPSAYRRTSCSSALALRYGPAWSKTILPAREMNTVWGK